LKTQRKISKAGKKFRRQSRSQRSRGKYLKPTPSKLGRLIDLVNGLPPFGSLNSTLLHPRHLESETEAELEKEGGRENDWFGIHLARLIAERLQSVKVSPAVLDYVCHGTEQGSIGSNKMMKDGGVVGRYENLWVARVRLRRIAHLAKADDDKFIERSTLWREPVRLPVLDEIDDQGYVRVSKDLFTEAMDQTDVEAVRIRECPVCTHIFWAGRKDSQHCGEARCKSVLSSRLNRNPALRKQYNASRRKKRRKHMVEKTRNSQKQEGNRNNGSL
jgi:hypothetical protein